MPPVAASVAIGAGASPILLIGLGSLILLVVAIAATTVVRGKMSAGVKVHHIVEVHVELDLRERALPDVKQENAGTSSSTRNAD